jgi:hypothetical protein
VVIPEYQGRNVKTKAVALTAALEVLTGVSIQVKCTLRLKPVA